MDIDLYTKDQLQKLLRERGVKFASKDNKKKLLELLQAAEAKEAVEPKAPVVPEATVPNPSTQKIASVAILKRLRGHGDSAVQERPNKRCKVDNTAHDSAPAIQVKWVPYTIMQGTDVYCRPIRELVKEYLAEKHPGEQFEVFDDAVTAAQEGTLKEMGYTETQLKAILRKDSRLIMLSDNTPYYVKACKHIAKAKQELGVGHLLKEYKVSHCKYALRGWKTAFGTYLLVPFMPKAHTLKDYIELKKAGIPKKTPSSV